MIKKRVTHPCVKDRDFSFPWIIMIKPLYLILKNKTGIPRKVGEYDFADLEQGVGKTLELKLGSKCNNNCVHCSFARKKNLKDRNTQEVKKILEKEKRDLLIFSGGEPTIRSDIFELLSYARKLNYRWVQIKTNGRMFSYKDFTKKIVDTIKNSPLPINPSIKPHQKSLMDYFLENLNCTIPKFDVTEFNIKIYGHNSKVHDCITGVPGSFNQTVEGIKNLSNCKSSFLITADIVINKLNYKYIPQIVRFLNEVGKIDLYEFNFVEIKGNPERNFLDIVPRISKVRPYLLRGRKEAKRRFLVNNLPFCFTEGFSEWISEFRYPHDYDWHNGYKKININNVITNDYQERTWDKVKGKNCSRCSYDSFCLGVNRVYANNYGFNEFKPIISSTTTREQFIPLEHLSRISLYDLNFEQAWKPGLKKSLAVKADALVFFSGGLDSTVAALLYARKNKNKKIALITIDYGKILSTTFYTDKRGNPFPSPAEAAHYGASILARKCKNIVGHFMVPVPHILVKKAILDGLEEDYKRFNRYVFCYRCFLMSRVAFGIYLLKKYFKGDTIISGSTKKELHPRHISLAKAFCREYSIGFVCPTTSLPSRKNLLSFARKEGLPLDPPQAMCIKRSFLPRFGLQKHSGHSSFPEPIVDFCKEIMKEWRESLSKQGIEK